MVARLASTDTRDTIEEYAREKPENRVFYSIQFDSILFGSLCSGADMRQPDICILYYAILYNPILSCSILCYVLLYVILFYTMLCYTIPSHTCYGTWYARHELTQFVGPILCYAIPCYSMLCTKWPNFLPFSDIFSFLDKAARAERLPPFYVWLLHSGGLLFYTVFFSNFKILIFSKPSRAFSWKHKVRFNVAFYFLRAI